jgi:hypothetical protein
VDVRDGEAIPVNALSEDRTSTSDGQESLRPTSICETKLTWGFNSKWNMRRQPIPVILAGSTFVYRMKDGLAVQRSLTDSLCAGGTAGINQVGAHKAEGYGEFRLFHMGGNDLTYSLGVTGSMDEEALSGNQITDEEALMYEQMVNEKVLPDEQPADSGGDICCLEEVWKGCKQEEAKEIIRRNIMSAVTEEAKRKVLRDVMDGAVFADISSSLNERVSLMLKEVLDMRKENGKKLSFKEQREFEQLDAEIPALEAEQKALEEQMSSSDFEQARIAGERYKEISAALEEKYTRWEELAALA